MLADGPNTQKQTGFTGLSAKLMTVYIAIYFALDNFLCKDVREKGEGSINKLQNVLQITYKYVQKFFHLFVYLPLCNNYWALTTCQERLHRTRSHGQYILVGKTENNR